MDVANILSQQNNLQAYQRKFFQIFLKQAYINLRQRPNGADL